ncbi:MAG TPA: glycine cleavage T C-terminal barrel domain-containing protein [Candidatus Dormibacteraeota bacterium]|nr:glycine cleavage T C-terminal barrel domain-containing protein [Candidatus Dormibacteraeota bacterium]
MQTPLVDEHRSEQARLAEFEGCELPERFAGLEAEYRAARESVAIFDTNWNAIWIVGGRDRVQYFHNITSNDVKSLAEGRGTLALLLNPQGRILAELEIYALPEKLLVRSHASQRERTLATLKKYVIGSKVEIDDATERMGSFAIEGPRAAEAVRQICGVEIEAMPAMSIREAAIDGSSCWLLRRSHFGAPGAEVIAAREHLAALWRKALGVVRELGGEPIGIAALNALRLEAGVPWFPVDFNDAMIPHEAALENTHISFTKGCYTGQEIVERVRSRGHVNRRRVSLKFSTSDAPTARTKLRAGGAEIGFVTSAAYSPSAGTALGMGYVRREQLESGTVVEFEGGTAEVK